MNDSKPFFALRERMRLRLAATRSSFVRIFPLCSISDYASQRDDYGQSGSKHTD